jgi:hypothetical protein
MKKHTFNTLVFHDMTVTLLPATFTDKLAFRWHYELAQKASCMCDKSVTLRPMKTKLHHAHDYLLYNDITLM